MTTRRLAAIGFIVALAIGAGWLVPARRAEAHCDTMDGPVVKAAQAALEQGDVTPVLKWIKPEHEGEIHEAFKKTLTVRALGGAARELADRYFFETLVRVHREGEGAPYMGLKPAGSVEPVIAASDKALEAGSVDDLARRITQVIDEGIRRRFAETVERMKHADESVAAGREYVRAYVEFIHYVERLHADATAAAVHEPATGLPPAHNSHGH